MAVVAGAKEQNARVLRRSRDESGQMTVELAVVIPVALIVVLIVVNAFSFLSAAAAFDQLAPKAVVFCSMDSSTLIKGEDNSSRIKEEIEEGMDLAEDDARVSISVSLDENDATSVFLGEQQTYRCELRYTPWPAPRAFSIAGVSTGTLFSLKRGLKFTVDPCLPGVVL